MGVAVLQGTPCGQVGVAVLHGTPGWQVGVDVGTEGTVAVAVDVEVAVSHNGGRQVGVGVGVSVAQGTPGWQGVAVGHGSPLGHAVGVAVGPLCHTIPLRGALADVLVALPTTSVTAHTSATSAARTKT